MENLLWNLLDFTTIVSTFIGFHVGNDDVGRYFLAIRVLKLVFLIKEVQFLNQEMKVFLSSFKKASYILVPALCLVYVFTIVGLYSFYGIRFLIQIYNTTDVGIQSTSTKVLTGQSMRIKCSFAERDPVQS